jgi:hypothetical protein
MRVRGDVIRVAALLLALAGCYKPGIGEGDFICGPSGACPSGFKCLGDNRCYRNSQILDAAGAGGSAGASNTGGSAGVGNTGGAAGGGTSGGPDTAPAADGSACFRGLTCSAGAPAGQKCDPVCQTGCGCQEKCVVANGAALCVPLPDKPADLYESCQPGMDSCRAGSLCTQENNPACSNHCYRACRADGDCGSNARCTEPYLDRSGAALGKVCGPKIDGCNPTGLSPECSNAGPGSRSFPTFGCYILDPGVEDSTGCDCAGPGEIGQMCEGRHSCKPGLECLATPAGDFRCRRLCTLPGAGLGVVGCPLPTQICKPIGTSLRYGSCM